MIYGDSPVKSVMRIPLISTAALLLFFAAAIPSSAQEAKPLFRILDTPERSLSPSSIASVEESAIEVDQQVGGTEILIPLFDGKTYKAFERGSEIRAIDDRTWRGKIAVEKFEGDVVITIRKGSVVGLIYSPDAVYEIVPRGGSHYLVKLNQSLFPECGGEVTSPKDEIAQAVSPVPEGSVPDSGDRIDVMVVYTTATKNFLGGDAAAQALAQAAIDATNTAYINSRVRQRVRMVHSQEFQYVESTGSADLSALRGSSLIQGLRDTHRADLVAEISEVTGVCGIGYLMGGTGGNSNNAFTVTARSCAVGNLSFAHELGHNMGSQHNPQNGSGATYSYGYGHYVDTVFRTVMSYVDPCPGGCTRRPYFSNPSINYLQYPTGIFNARDNARSLNNTADAISNYRNSGAGIMMQAFFNGGILPRGIRRNVTWQSAGVSGNVRILLTRDDGVTWETLIFDTPNDGNEPITVWGPATKNGRLRVASSDAPHVSDTSTGQISIR
jgi:hypothetical protein